MLESHAAGVHAQSSERCAIHLANSAEARGSTASLAFFGLRVFSVSIIMETMMDIILKINM